MLFKDKLRVLQSDINLFERVALYSARLIVLLILSGGFVRLSDSGLGCPDWPNCEGHSFVAPARFHPLVEDINRLINVLVGCELVLLFVFAWLIKPKRNDLRFWSFFLVFMVGVEGIVGAIVVYSHLWPPIVMIHFTLGIVMVAGGVVLHHSVKHPVKFKNQQVAITNREKQLLLAFVIAVFVVILSGTFATGSGPHGGAPNAARIPFSFEHAVEIHALAVACFFSLLAVIYLKFVSKDREPYSSVVKWLGFTALAVIIQAIIGIVQFQLHVPIWLVEIHLLGVCVVSSLTVKTYLVGITTEMKLAPVKLQASLH